MNHTHKGTCCHSHSNSNSNHEHEHEHACGCNCGYHQTEIKISEQEKDFLRQLAQTPFLPLASFVLKSSKSSHLESVAFAPVYINNKEDSMETARNMAVVLKSLEEKGLITLDYDEPLENGDYTDYSDSALYAYFRATVAEAKNKEGFLFDIPALELGSVALTYSGQLAIKDLDKL